MRAGYSTRRYVRASERFRCSLVRHALSTEMTLHGTDFTEEELADHRAAVVLLENTQAR